MGEIMSKLKEIMNEWSSRPQCEKFRSAVNVMVNIAEEHPQKTIDEVMEALERSVFHNMRKRGYRINKVELMSRSMDFGYMLGFGASVELQKDPNASAIVYISSCYELALAQEKASRDQLEKRWYNRFFRIFDRRINWAKQK